MLKEKLTEYKRIIDESLLEYIPDETPENLAKSMEYSLSAGGKRIRPILLLLVCDNYNISRKISLPLAVSLEYIHTYSLIHDDLPAMDDDDYRRGKPTNHKVFGESMAILAGDGLLTQAFSIVAGIEQLDSDKKAEVVKVLAENSGPAGMIKGQVLDMESEGKVVEDEMLVKIHEHKTGKLLTAPLKIAGIISGINQKQQLGLDGYGKYLGLTFQVTDDILDSCGDFQLTGKPIGSDKDNQKATYVTIYGLEKAKKMAENYGEKAIQYLDNSNLDIPYLPEIIAYLLNRKS